MSNVMLFEVVELGISPPAGGFVTTELIYCDWDGIKGDKHSGIFTTVGVQEASRLRKMGIPVSRQEQIFNGRQVSMVSWHELLEIENALGITRQYLQAELLRANIVVKSTLDYVATSTSPQAPRISDLPNGTLIHFQGNSRPILQVHRTNEPCTVVGGYIEEAAETPGIANRFPKAAHGLRGLVLFVFRPGKIKVGDQASTHLPG